MSEQPKKREPVVIKWPGGDDPFLFHLDDMMALEEATDEGLGAIWWRLSALREGTVIFKMKDVTETLRFGLMGAGMDRAKATRKVKDALEWHGLAAMAAAAYEVLSYTMVGGPDAKTSGEER